MNFLNPITNWQAQDLPEGLSINNGVISGTPTTAGAFKASVSVSNELGSDTKNITFFVKYKPGTQKFSILQDGEEVAKVTIPELQAMVQDGTAQERFNCTNTQIVLPILTPKLKMFYNSGTGKTPLDEYLYTRPASIQDVAINFCSFRNVTLSDGTTKAGLILQFDKTLWAGYAPFDTGDAVEDNLFNRWRYSNLRQWLNSEGANWFTPAYEGDALVTQREYVSSQKYYNEIQRTLAEWRATYADDGSLGFLDLLPDDLHSILVPIKVVTPAYFDESNTNTSIEDPEDVDGQDADITYDKVFIPSFNEMFIGFKHTEDYSAEELQAIADEAIEGKPWEFYKHKMTPKWEWYIENHGDYGPVYITTAEGQAWNYGYSSPFCYNTAYPNNYPESNKLFLEAWGDNLFNSLVTTQYFYDSYANSFPNEYQNVLTRTAKSSATSGVGRIFSAKPESSSLWDIYATFEDNSPGHFSSNVRTASPAPAFVIC